MSPRTIDNYFLKHFAGSIPDLNSLLCQMEVLVCPFASGTVQAGSVSRGFSDYLLLCWSKCVLFLGPEELVFLVLCSHPSMNSPAHKRHSQMKFFLAPVMLRPCGCRNKVCDLKKAVTCFLRCLTNCVLASCSDLCGGWKGSGFPQAYPNILLPELLVWAHLGRASLIGPLASS